MKRNDQPGKYRLLREISYRGPVIIYEAEDLDLKRRVAIKALHLDEIRDKRERHAVAEHFRDEIYYLGQMEHQNIVKMFEGCEEGHSVYMVMEFAQCGTLAWRYPPGSKLPFSLVRRYACHIGHALQHMHERGLLHRDVKPSNIFLGSENWALLGDFGLAMLEADIPQGIPRYSRPVGTWAYMAPELAHDWPSTASDQYALAIMLFEWLTGASPFEGEGYEIFLQRQQYQAPYLREFAQDIPLEVESVVLKALEPSPSDRYDSVLDFIEAFTTAFHTVPVRYAAPARSSYPPSSGRVRPYSARMYYTRERVTVE